MLKSLTLDVLSVPNQFEGATAGHLSSPASFGEEEYWGAVSHHRQPALRGDLEKLGGAADDGCHGRSDCGGLG